MAFVEALKEGLLGESDVAKWLNRRGWDILPAYDVQIDSGKGPRLFTASVGQLITPDLLAFNETKIIWIEVKTKTAFSWYRKGSYWTTGIDRRHWRDYLKVDNATPFPLWLLFLHKPHGTAKDTPNDKQSPSGLYGGEIGNLFQRVDHEHENHGPSGMVYWKEPDLIKICTYAEIFNG